MTALFDRPHPAHRGDEPVMWFGVLLDSEAFEVVAIYANIQGGIQTCPLREVRADVAYVPDLGKYPTTGRTGPGWLDLEDMVEEPSLEDSVAQLKANVAEALTAPAAPEPSPDYITDREGNKYDRETGKPLDT